MAPRSLAAGDVTARAMVPVDATASAQLVAKGELAMLRDAMKAGRDVGMQTFDQALFDLWRAGRLDLEALITGTRPLDEINEAFADLTAGAGVATPAAFVHLGLAIVAVGWAPPVPSHDLVGSWSSFAVSRRVRYSSAPARSAQITTSERAVRP